MSVQRLYINGVGIEMMGSVTDHFQEVETTTETSRSGRTYSNSETVEKYVEVETILLDPADVQGFEAFINGCAAHETRFAVTITEAEDCEPGQNRECIYQQCLIRGRASYSKFDRKVSGFMFSYESKRDRVT